jgi:hypothetical protein
MVYLTNPWKNINLMQLKYWFVNCNKVILLSFLVAFGSVVAFAETQMLIQALDQSLIPVFIPPVRPVLYRVTHHVLY